MADTVGSLATLVQTIADDQEANWLDLPVQLPLINAGWEDLQDRLTLAGSPFMRETVTLTVPAGTTQITLTGATVNGTLTASPVLPADFAMPEKLEERPAGQTTTDFTPMDEQILHDLPPRPYLGVWTWETGALNFIGATVNLEVRMRYARVLDSFASEDDVIPIPRVKRALAWATLFTVAVARGADAIREKADQMTERYLAIMMGISVKRDQIQRVHRAPHRRGRF